MHQEAYTNLNKQRLIDRTSDSYRNDLQLSGQNTEKIYQIEYTCASQFT
jgi:hypothetical protein